MNIFNNMNNGFDSDIESDLDISWIEEQEKLQQINANYFKEPMETIDIYFIYINTNDYIEKINCMQHNLTIIDNNSIIHNKDVINLIEQNKYLSNNKYKIQDILLYNISLQPENIQSYSKNEQILESSSKFLEPLSIINDFIIPPSIFIFHKINSIFFIFKQLQEIKPIPKSILRPNVISNDKPMQKTKKVRILEYKNIKQAKINNRATRKQT